MKFNLVDRRNDLPSLLELLEIGDRPIAYADRLDLAGRVDFLHLSPCLSLIPGSVDGPSSVGIHGEKLLLLILCACQLHLTTT